MRRSVVLGIRLHPAEMDMLKTLAQREGRSPAGWIRFRILSETRAVEFKQLGIITRKEAVRRLQLVAEAQDE